MEISASTRSVEHKYEKSSDPLENVKIELQHENFIVRLCETPIVDAIFNVYGLDEKNGNKYESLIYVEHFDGQDCQPYIRNNPDLIEKLFEFGKCDISIKDSKMICDFKSDIMLMRITLPKSSETEAERMRKTIDQQKAKILALEEENKHLDKAITALKCETEMKFDDLKKQIKRLAEISTDEKYVLENDGYPRDILGSWYSNRDSGIYIAKNENSFMIGKELKLPPINAMWKEGIFQWQCANPYRYAPLNDMDLYQFDPKNPTVMKMNSQEYRKT
jgi:hypothetical protein